MSDPIVTVFGGTGFLGRRVVRRLRAHGFQVRIAVRRPAEAAALFDPEDAALRPVRTDVGDAASVAEALQGAYAAVNAVSLYVERGGATFHSVHVEAAERVAAEAKRAGVERLAHLSGIGSDPHSASLYIRKRGEGELAVQAAFEGATLVRPAVMFGPGDAFLTAIVRLLRRLPVFPLFGDGATRLQPAYADDVAEVIARVLEGPPAPPRTLECGGPHIYRYRELVEIVARAAGMRPRLAPVPFALWRPLARIAEVLPGAPLTLNQVELMQIDNVASAGKAGIPDFGVSARSIEEVLPQILAK